VSPRGRKCGCYFAPCNLIQDSLWFWNPQHEFRIPDTRFRILVQYLSVEFGFHVPFLARFQIPQTKFSGIRITLHGLRASYCCARLHPCRLDSTFAQLHPMLSLLRDRPAFGLRVSYCCARLHPCRLDSTPAQLHPMLSFLRMHFFPLFRSISITGYLPFEVLGASVYNYVHHDDMAVYSKAHELRKLNFIQYALSAVK